MNYFQTLAKAIGDYLASLALFFTNIKNAVTDGVNASNGLKEGGKVNASLKDADINPQLIKKTAKKLIYIVPISVASGQIIADIDLEGYESMTMIVSDGGITTAVTTYMGASINLNTPYAFTYVGSRYAPYNSSVISSVNGTAVYKGNKKGRFLRIIKSQNSSDPTSFFTLEIFLHQEIWVEPNLNLLANPTSLFRNLVNSLTTTTSQALFTASTTRLIYNLKEIYLTNTQSTAVLVTITGTNPLTFSVPANGSLALKFDIPPQAPGNTPFSISISTAGNPVYIYASAYLTLL